MSKINNNLILLFGLFAFVLLSFTASPAYASRADMPVRNPFFRISDIQGTSYQYSYFNNRTISIPGCEGRNTGYSTVNGQSCYGNYVPNNNLSYNTSTQQNSNTNSTKNYTSSTTNNTNKNSTANSTSNTQNQNSNQTDMNNDNNSGTTNTTGSPDDINENYGGVTANALLGSHSFMPTGLVQWIFLILIVLAIIFLWRYVHGEEKYMSEPMKHA